LYFQEFYKQSARLNIMIYLIIFKEPLILNLIIDLKSLPPQKHSQNYCTIIFIENEPEN
jgi:hypothetical protein